jgi:hypothetical protein
MWLVWEKGEEHTGFWWWDLRERPHLEDLDADGNIILNWSYRSGMEHGLVSSDPGYGDVAGSCECGNEPLGSKKCGEFLD